MWGESYAAGGRHCDEYPFQATYEGSATSTRATNQNPNGGNGNKWHDYDAARTVSAAGLAALMPFVLALAAIGIVGLLARRGRRLAAAGATLLALAALPHLDAALDAVPMPTPAGDRTALFAWYAITPQGRRAT
ncbi:hypothetical protein [Micromonospora sp. KC207]|uniref:hypothetical protein n=1 Tax=Micromonospora sp. KC207 TaxID=2530377 RepID=UPI0014043ED7|nr:hypothetical protein [Micromonospora sp. KC207]